MHTVPVYIWMRFVVTRFERGVGVEARLNRLRLETNYELMIRSLRWHQHFAKNQASTNTVITFQKSYKHTHTHTHTLTHLNRAKLRTNSFCAHETSECWEIKTASRKRAEWARPSACTAVCVRTARIARNDVNFETPFGGLGSFSCKRSFLPEERLLRATISMVS